MDKKLRIDEEVEKTLRSLDAIQRAEPAPFFLTRVQARLENWQSATLPRSWVFRPAWVAASLGLVLLLNVSTVVYMQDVFARHEQEQESTSLTTDWGFTANALDW